MKRLTLVVILVCCVIQVYSQVINGPATVASGEAVTYTFDNGIIYSSYNWGITNGYSIYTNRSGTTYSVFVSWSGTGTGTVAFLDNYYNVLATKTVTITASSCTTPATPTGLTFTEGSNTCGSKSLSYSGALPPSGVTWFWQTSATGTSTSNPSSYYTANTSGYYYVRAKSNSGSCWSTSAASYYVATVYSLPGTPTTPLVSSNTCGAKTLTAGTPPSGITWFWQGANASGTDISNSGSTFIANTSGTYYIRSRNNSTLCWGNSASVSVSIGNPPPPNSPTPFTFCEWESKNITTTGYPSGGSLRWYNSSGSTLLFTGTSFNVDALKTGYYIYRIKAYAINGCESFDYVTVTVDVPFNCDQKLNWSKSIGYGIDGNGNPQAQSSSIQYTDGFGKAMQVQSKMYTNNQVMASQPLYDHLGNAAATTLSAPINSSEFAYRHNFVTNATGQRYGVLDFDLISGSGSYDNPKPVGSDGSGSLGWYYSSANSLEPLTPTTSYPYSRTYTPDGPDPVITRNAAAGDAFKMGAGHESKTERSKIQVGELDHYFGLRHFFVSTPSPYSNTNLLSYITTNTTTQFTAYQNVSLASVAGYLNVTCNQTTGTPGVWCGIVSVTPGKVYTFRIKGYRSSGGNVNLSIRDMSDNNLVWPGEVLPLGGANETWVTTTFTAPAGIYSVKVGVLWNQPATGNVFNISGVEVKPEAPASVIGYKYISTDPDGKKSVTFVDIDGHTLANALVTPGNTYETWSYTYYNDMGQLVASVTPNGVDIGSTALPGFVTTYKYDHLGRMIETTSVDEGTSQFVYSLDGKIRFSQNQEQRSATPKRFSYTNYDYLGRLIESGEYSIQNTNPLVFEPQTTASPATNSVLNIVEKTLPQGYTMDNVTASNYASLLGISAKGDSRCMDYSYIIYDVPGTSFPTDTYHPTQKINFGQVSKTENLNAKTWYSYNEFGQLVWTKQSVPGWANKTIDYTYDYLGNVTSVIYQKGLADKFYHYYMYDADQRLTNVYTNTTGTLNTATDLRANYYYYLHGPLKRTELLNGNTKLQGIDFLYTIQGALKAINQGAQSNDPGKDGMPGSANETFMPDAFGETMHYFDNDYTAANYTPTTVTLSSTAYPNQFGGNLRALTFNNSTDKIKTDNSNRTRIFGYKYDNLNQLNIAAHGEVTGTTPVFSGAYNENVNGYDKNGNILGLDRSGKEGEAMADYGYIYETNTNKLDKVYNADTVLIDYTYNAIGQMIQQTEGGKTFKISYNAYGLTKEIRDITGGSNKLVQTYHYDDRGDLLKKVSYYNGTVAKTTYYVNDASGNTLAVYEKLGTGTLNLAELMVYGAGRIGTLKGNTYYYEVNDHLGNVRAVIGAAATESYTATMESETPEDFPATPFRNIAYTRASDNPLANVSGNESARLNKDKPAGPAIMLPVSPGDKVNVNAWAYYSGSGSNSSIDNSLLLAAIAQAFGGVPGGPGESGKIYTNVSNGLAGVLGNEGGSGSTFPAAFITYMVYDNNMNRLWWGSKAVSVDNSNQHENVIVPTVTIEQPGYVYVCLYNRSLDINPVYFDDFKVTIDHSPVVAGADYYPFGLAMDGREITDEPYRYGYQGQYAEKDSTTGWNEFELRMYDARFGRWLSPDPYGQYASPYLGMGNIPNIGTDPDGGLCCGGALLPISTTAADVAASFTASMKATVLKGVTITAKRTLYTIPGLVGWHTLNEVLSSAYELNINAPTGALGTTPRMIVPEPTIPSIRDINLSTVPKVDPLAIDINISPPSFAESMIPIWGSGREAAAAFAKGNYWTGLGHTALAISDVFLVKAIATAGAKLLIKGSARAFYSGGQEALNAAIKSGHRTIEATRAGKNLTNLIKSRNIEYINEGKGMWSRLSRTWAMGASEAHFYGNPNIPGSVWKTVEEPILKARGVRIHYHIHH